MAVKKYKKIWITIGCSMICLILLGCSIFLPSSNSYYNDNIKWMQSLGVFAYETLRYKSTEEEKQQARPIIKKVEEALAYVGTEAECGIEEPYKALCIGTETYRHVRVDYNVEFITFKKWQKSGYLWFEFTVTQFDDAGVLVHAAQDILAYVKVELIDNEWVAVRLQQAP